MRELDDLRGRHEGVVDVLRALSRSGMKLQPILDQIVATAARLCRSDSCFVYLAEGELLRMRANIGQPQEVVEYERLHPGPAGSGQLYGTGGDDQEAGAHP
jgi:two-component system NtrC family sensor kinase